MKNMGEGPLIFFQTNGCLNPKQALILVKVERWAYSNDIWWSGYKLKI